MAETEVERVRRQIATSERLVDAQRGKVFQMTIQGRDTREAQLLIDNLLAILDQERLALQRILGSG